MHRAREPIGYPALPVDEEGVLVTARPEPDRRRPRSRADTRERSGAGVPVIEIADDGYGVCAFVGQREPREENRIVVRHAHRVRSPNDSRCRGGGLRAASGARFRVAAAAHCIARGEGERDQRRTHAHTGDLRKAGPSLREHCAQWQWCRRSMLLDVWHRCG